MSGCAASGPRRSNPARARMGCVTISFHADLDVRDAEIAAHAEFRKHLYDHDVVPEARAAATELV